MIRPEELETPEASLELETRERGVQVLKKRPEEARKELAALRERLAAARKLRPERDGLHCRDCFERGRNAALDFVEGSEGQ